MLVTLFAEGGFAQEIHLRRETPTRKKKVVRARAVARPVPRHHQNVYATPGRLLRRSAERIEVPDENGRALPEDRIALSRPRRNSATPTKLSPRDRRLVKTGIRPLPRRHEPEVLQTRTGSFPADRSARWTARDNEAPSGRMSTDRGVLQDTTHLRTSPRHDVQLIDRRLDQELFHAHGTESARTLKPGQWSYSRVAGVDSVEGIFLLNSVNVGVLDGVQIGTNPFLYLIPDSFNFAAKVRFYDSPTWTFAAGYFHWTARIDFMSRATLHSNGLSFIANYRWDEDWAFSYLTHAMHTYTNFESVNFETEGISELSHIADVQYQWAPHWLTTAGLSWSPGVSSTTVTANRMTPGIGASVTWKYPKSWFFAYPSVGVHFYPERATQSILISAYFHP